MSNQLIADLMSMGLTEPEAWRTLTEADRVTAGLPRHLAERALQQLFARVLARRSRPQPADGSERLVPAGYERT